MAGMLAMLVLATNVTARAWMPDAGAESADDSTAIDVSDKIVNATFDTAGDATGWTLTRGATTHSTSAAIKNGVLTGRYYFDLKQTITGLQPGIYRVQANAFTRPDENTTIWATVQAGGTLANETYLYANGDSVNVPLITSEGWAESFSGSTYLEGLGYVPNSSSGASTAFGYGMYEVSVEATVGTDSTLTFGITNLTDEYATYAGCDNFKLFYLGEKSDISAEEVAALIATVPTGKMEAAVQTALETAVAALQSDATTDNYYAAIEAINNANASVTAYASVKAALDEADAAVVALSDTAREQYTAAVADIVSGYEAGTLTGDCTAEVAAIQSALQAAKLADMESSDDRTALIVNPQFEDGTTGWSGDFGNGAKKGQADNYVITCYGSGFDVYQTLTGMTPGTYRLQAQAFSRPASNDDTWTAYQAGETLTNETYIYGNNVEQRVMLIVEDYLTEAQSSGAWSTYTLNGSSIYVPNNSTAFSLAFSAGLYDNELLCTVGSDGLLTIGVKNLDSSNSVAYAGFDNFRLTYVSTDTIIPEEVEVVTLADTIAYVQKLNSIATQATDHSAFDAVYDVALAKLQAEEAAEADVQAAYDDIVAAFNHLLKTGTTATGQFDLTGLLGNATFDTDAKGWTQTNGSLKWNSIGSLIGSNIQGGEKLSKTLENMPAGKYTLKVQGFYRAQGWKQALYDREHGTEEVKLNLFLNGESVRMKSMFEDARYLLASACISRREDVGSTIDGRGFPLLNDSKVTEALSPGGYWNLIEVNVAEDGSIDLGVQLDATDLTDNWVVLDNFRLYYGEHNTVTLASGTNYTMADDTPADVIIKKSLTAGAPVPFAAPCDIPGSKFKAVYEIGSIDQKARKVTIFPVENVRAGVPCYVEVDEDIDSIIVGPTVLRAETFDKAPVNWDGGVVYPFYRSLYWRSTSIAGINNACTFFTNVEKQDLMNLNFIANVENVQVRQFLTIDYSNTSAVSVVANYNTPAPARRDIPHPVGIPVPQSKSEGAVLKYSLSADLADAKTLAVVNGAAICYIPNLVPDTTYYFAVESADGNVVVKGQVGVEGPFRSVYAPSVYNIRDFGGYTMSDGRVTRYGLIFRGGEVNGSHPAIQGDLQTLKDLGIGAEIDLRYNDSYDADRETGKSGYGFVLGDTYYFAGSNWYTADHISNTSAQAQVKEEFEFLMKHIREGRGVHFHCTFGADRTGWLAVLLEGLLGFDIDEICHDYEMTSFAAPAGNRNKSTILAIVEAVKANSTGSTLRDYFENYWIEKIGITADEVEEFRNIMLRNAPVPVGIDTPQTTASEAARATVQSVFTVSGVRVPQAALNGRRGIYVVKYSDGTSKKVVVK